MTALNILALVAALLLGGQPVDVRFDPQQVTPGKDSYTINVPALADGEIDLRYRFNNTPAREAAPFCRLDAQGRAVIPVHSGIPAGVVEVLGIRRSGTAKWLETDARLRILPEYAPAPVGQAPPTSPLAPPRTEPLARILWRDLKLLGTAALALLSILSAGRWLLVRLSRRAKPAPFPYDDRTEAIVFAWALGCLAIGALSLALALCGLVYRGAFFILAFLLLLAWSRKARWPPRQKRARTRIEQGCWLLGAFYGGIYFVAALAPEVSPDAIHYHLGMVHLYQVNHRMMFYPETFYSALPQGMEMVYLFCSSLGGYSIARLAHLGCLVALAAAIQAFGRRLGYPAGGAIAAVAVFTASLFGTTGTTGYVDVAVTLGVFLSFYAAFLWRASGTPSHLWMAGLLAGWAMSIKPTGAVAVPIVLAMVLSSKSKVQGPKSKVQSPKSKTEGSSSTLDLGPWTLDPWRPRLRSAALVLVLAAAVVAPWLIRNWIVFQNPFMPLGNRWFPNSHLSGPSEAVYLEGLRRWGGFGDRWQDYLKWPQEVTLRGTLLQGFLGPFFLLAPLAVVAAKKPEGRWLLAAGVISALPLSGNILTRFLMPAIPFVALAMVIGIYALFPPRVAGLILGLLLAVHGAFNLPWVIARRSAIPFALSEVPFRAAFRLESEHDYLARRLESFPVVQFLQNQTPIHTRVLSFGPFPQAYTSRFLLLFYVSEMARKAVDTVYDGFEVGRSPDQQMQARFPLVKTRALRLKQGRKELYSYWSIFELEVLDAAGRPLPRQELRYSANVNPFDAGLAADGNPLTCWDTGSPLEPNTWFQVDLGGEREVREIRYRIRPNEAYLVPEVLASSGHSEWVPLKATFGTVTLAPHNWRREAAAFLKSWNLHYLLFFTDSDDPFISGLHDLVSRPEEWGLREVFHSGNTVLLELR